jgi:NDP-sugar pyrophosphorylase family protein
MPIKYADSYWARCWASGRSPSPEIKGAILSAGLGKRLEPLSAYQRPKPLFPLGGKIPIAEMWVRRFIQSGITDVSLNVCVLAESIKRHFGNGAKLGVDLTFVEEEVPSGTLGGVCKMTLGSAARRPRRQDEAPAIPPFAGSTVIVPSGDIVANFGAELLQEMHDIHRRAGAALSMVLTPVPEDRRKDFGTAVLDAPTPRKGPLNLSGRVSAFLEKDPHSPSCLNNASIYMIETSLLKAADAQRTEARLGLDEPFYDFGKHLFPAMLGKLPYVSLPRDAVLWGIQFDGPWFDVGNKRDYLRVNESVLDGVVEVPLTYEALPWGWLGANVSIDFSAVEIRPPVVIGNDCVVEAGAVLGPYAVIGDGWRIEGGAEVSHSVLWERYPFFVDGRREIPMAERRRIDRHEIRAGARVQESIVAGGGIEADVIGQTVDVREDGQMVVLPIDYVPAEARV